MQEQAVAATAVVAQQWLKHQALVDPECPAATLTAYCRDTTTAFKKHHHPPNPPRKAVTRCERFSAQQAQGVQLVPGCWAEAEAGAQVLRWAVGVQNQRAQLTTISSRWLQRSTTWCA